MSSASTESQTKQQKYISFTNDCLFQLFNYSCVFLTFGRTKSQVYRWRPGQIHHMNVFFSVFFLWWNTQICISHPQSDCFQAISCGASVQLTDQSAYSSSLSPSLICLTHSISNSFSLSMSLSLSLSHNHSDYDVKPPFGPHTALFISWVSEVRTYTHTY